ncbi:MAG TPA: amidohydrolase family protein [Alphaproteobacteria bacterium]|nr:amidohydrolase family protein [Alphaproteobacteria bacterium]
MHDLVIRGGTIIDGSGGARFTGDVAIDNGVITAVGTVSGKGKKEIDAKGLLVTPGFVDVHTHYDAQVSWDALISPSCWHGVTTVVMGNCGVGFAPARPEQRDALIALMEGVEDIPGAVLTEGMKWEWESFAEYLNAIESKPHALDIGAQLPHAALRVYVMGERAIQREAATDADIKEMGRLAAEAMQAGAIGFSSSRSLNHRSRDGDVIPSYGAERKELVGIAKAMGDTGKGVFEMISDFTDMDAEFSILRDMAEVSKLPMSISLIQFDQRPDGWRELLNRIEGAANDGLRMKGQVAARPICLLLGLQATMNPFSNHATYRTIADLPLNERVARMRDPQFRAQILSEKPKGNPLLTGIFYSMHKIFPLGDPPDYEPPVEKSVKALAEARGVSPEELVYDMILENDGKALLYAPLANYTANNLDVSREMILSPHTAFGLGDGGAHCSVICDASFPTTHLIHWGRDRTRGEKLPLEYLVKRQTQDTARLVGFLDRGVIAPGMKADLNVIDFDNLTLGAPHIVFDLPAGGQRLIQKASGYKYTIVSGEVTFKDGESTGALPGRLLRGRQDAPVLKAAQ